MLLCVYVKSFWLLIQKTCQHVHTISKKKNKLNLACLAGEAQIFFFFACPKLVSSTESTIQGRSLHLFEFAKQLAWLLVPAQKNVERQCLCWSSFRKNTREGSWNCFFKIWQVNQSFHKERIWICGKHCKDLFLNSTIKSKILTVDSTDFWRWKECWRSYQSNEWHRNGWKQNNCRNGNRWASRKEKVMSNNTFPFKHIRLFYFYFCCCCMFSWITLLIFLFWTHLFWVFNSSFAPCAFIPSKSCQSFQSKFICSVPSVQNIFMHMCNFSSVCVVTTKNHFFSSSQIFKGSFRNELTIVWLWKAYHLIVIGEILKNFSSKRIIRALLTPLSVAR